MPYFGYRPGYRATLDPESEPIVQKPRGGLAGLMEQLPEQTQEALQTYGMGDILMDLGMPAVAGSWKLTPNAPSWLRRAFEGGEREIPLQGGTPRRVPQGNVLVKNPVTYELPESNAGLRQLLEQEGGAYTGLGGEEGRTRLYRGEGTEPSGGLHAGEWFTTDKTKAQRFKSFSDKGRLKFVDAPQDILEQYEGRGVFKNATPDEYIIPREIQDKLWTRFLKEQPKRKLPPVSGGAPSMFEKFTGF